MIIRCDWILPAGVAFLRKVMKSVENPCFGFGKPGDQGDGCGELRKTDVQLRKTGSPG